MSLFFMIPFAHPINTCVFMTPTQFRTYSTKVLTSSSYFPKSNGALRSALISVVGSEPLFFLIRRNSFFKFRIVLSLTFYCNDFEKCLAATATP